MEFLYAFAAGGFFCVLGQLLLDKTSLTPARILVFYVVAGVILQAAGLYEPLINLAQAGATVPLTGFGAALARGVRQAVDQKGFLGIFIGGLRSSAGGITAAMLSGLVMSLVFRPRDKS